jgi:hypothetical protein
MVVFVDVFLFCFYFFICRDVLRDLQCVIFFRLYSGLFSWYERLSPKKSTQLPPNYLPLYVSENETKITHVYMYARARIVTIIMYNNGLSFLPFIASIIK